MADKKTAPKKRTEPLHEHWWPAKPDTVAHAVVARGKDLRPLV
jgi:hypothetical protein